MAEPRAFRRIAIINRGEPAVRLLRAVRELNAQRDEPYRTIALYTTPDARAKFVREADDAYPLGDALYVDAEGLRKNSYLDYDRLRRALVETGAEAAWVGWGLVAEHAAFADLCDELGVVFIGPGGDVMRQLGDKITSKRIAQEAGVPVAPWSQGPVETLEDARAHAERIGYPLMVKATAGGGGRGIRKARSAADLADAFERARSEAYAGFGDATVFLERMLLGARHIEVQIIGDGEGTTWGLGVRDCTVQRRNQKVFEEAPSPVLTPAQDEEIRAAAARLGDAVGYRNAGTVEFLYDPRSQKFSFMEVNARLQVEHPVTELATGADLVKLQLYVAGGGRLSELPVPPHRGHAIEARITAEAPERGFAPAPGVVERLRLPAGPGVRVDAGVDEGDEIASQFDSMVAKVIAFGADREESLARLKRALSEMELLIRGGASNKGFLLGLLDHPAFRSGEIDVGWLDGLTEANAHVSRRGASVALLEAAIQGFLDEEAVDRRRFYATAARGRPQPSETRGRRLELAHEGGRYEVLVRQLGARRFALTVDGVTLEVDRERLGGAIRLRCGERRWNALSTDQGVDRVVEIDGIPHRVATEGGGTLRAMAPGVVVSLAVSPGQRVEAGDRVVVLEAMKTEMAIGAPFRGRVKRVLVEPNVQVPAGAPLLQIEPESDGDADQAVAGGRLAFGELACAPAEPPSRRHLAALRSLLLGYDADPAVLEATLAEHGVLTPGEDPASVEVFAQERELFRLFADVGALFRRKPSADVPEEEAQSEAEYLQLFLRDLGSEGTELPAPFLKRLRRALAHHGVGDLEPSIELRDALFRIFKSHGLWSAQRGPLRGILQRWLDHAEALRPASGDDFRTLLEDLVRVTQGRYPGLHDLALEARHRFFERPVLEAAREAHYAEVSARLEAIARRPQEATEEDLRALVETPQPLRAFLGGWLRRADAPLREVIVEVLARRYYRARDLRDGRRSTAGGHAAFVARFEHEGRDHQLVAVQAERDRLVDVARSVAGELADAAAGVTVVLELYVWDRGNGDPSAALAAQSEALRHDLDGAGLPDRVGRVVVGFSSSSDGTHAASSQEHFTFDRNGEGRFEEVAPLRGLHPMMAERLALWRLTEHFEIERVPTVEDLYLFRMRAATNPKDERLCALTEVRDMSPVRDEAGRVVGIPALERQLLEALAAIRVVQSQRSERDRYEWNRVRLFVRPPIELTPDELSRLAYKLGPVTRGHGLEQVEVSGRFRGPDGALQERRLVIAPGGDSGLRITSTEPPTSPLQPLSAYHQTVIRLRRRGLTYPYALLESLTGETRQGTVPAGRFEELDLDDAGTALVPVDRPPGNNRANIVAGRLIHFTDKHPEGMARVVLLGDPSRSMGSLAEAECRIIIAALDLAERERIPLEWVAVSAGARIAMDTGTENMDWIAHVLKRLIEFTQAGHEVNVIVAGINVGAQPYWNAEATMLMHTRGVLIQTAQGAMVLTGKRALDYSGGVSAEDDFGIGGYDRVMGPNGQAQYFAEDLSDAYQILFRHYDHTYRAPGERFPRRARTTDPVERDIRAFPHPTEGFQTLGQVFSETDNPGRKRPFDIRQVLRAVSDQDHEPLPRWSRMRDAEAAVVWDAHVGGYPVCLIGLESRPLPRLGPIPADGPDHWTGGTLFPLSSKKVARAINATSGNRPLVILANLSGFDGSPESMRRCQLEFGAEIGRAVVNFDGPIVFTVISRYHGGAFVVFSARLNPGMEVAALEGAHASVIGGAPAAGVVFAREVQQATDRDPRLLARAEAVAGATGPERVRLQGELDRLRRQIHSEKLGEKAREFDTVHSVERARDVGSVHCILPPETLRPYLVDAIERGMERAAANGPRTG